MSNKRIYLYFFILFFFLLSQIACNPKTEKHYHISIVTSNPGSSHDSEGFVKYLSSRGYVRGKNTTFYYRAKDEEVDSFIKRMVDKNVDLFFCVTTPITKSLKRLTEENKIPVVFIVNDPLNSHIVNSIKKPGGNLTGIQLSGSTPKALEWLKSLFHNTANVWVPVSFDTKAALQSLNDLEKAAKKLNIKIWTSEVKNKNDLKRTLDVIPEEIDSIFTFHSVLINSNLDLIVKKSIEYKLPLAASGHEQYKKGALLSYGVSHHKVAKHAGRLADSILKGSDPANIPVETADFTLGLNLKTAKEINVEIPEHFIEQANEILY